MYWLPYSYHTSHHPSQTSCLCWISYATQKLMLDSCKMVEKQSKAFHTFLWHFWNSPAVTIRCRVYSNCCCSCSFEAEIIKNGQSSHKMYSNSMVNFQEFTTISNAYTKKSGNLLNAPRIYIWREYRQGVSILLYVMFSWIKSGALSYWVTLRLPSSTCGILANAPSGLNFA